MKAIIARWLRCLMLRLFRALARRAGSTPGRQTEVLLQAVRACYGSRPLLAGLLAAEEVLHGAGLQPDDQPWLPSAWQPGQCCLIISAAGDPWQQQLADFLCAKGAKVCQQATLTALPASLSCEQHYTYWKRMVDWCEEGFPAAGEFPWVFISPALAALGHRPALLRWLQQRYGSGYFVLRLPALVQTLYEQVRAHLGRRLSSDLPWQVYYSQESLRLEFGLWHQVSELSYRQAAGEYCCLLQPQPVPVPAQHNSAPLISVVVPVYNSEPYLELCLESLLGQTLTNMEVIVVNDASPDGSQAIIDRYVAADSRVRSLIHQQNSGGVGGPRNTGAAVAQGRYLALLDSDDYLHPAALETACYLLDTLEVEGLSFSFISCPGREIMPSGNAYLWLQPRPGELFFLHENSYLIPAAQSKIFLQRLVCGHRFVTSFYEDLVHTAQLGGKIPRVLTCPVQLYGYRSNPQSITGSLPTWRHFHDYLQVMLQLFDYWRQHGTTPQQYWLLLRFHLCFNLLPRLRRVPLCEREALAQRVWQAHKALLIQLAGDEEAASWLASCAQEIQQETSTVLKALQRLGQSLEKRYQRDPYAPMSPRAKLMQ